MSNIAVNSHLSYPSDGEMLAAVMHALLSAVGNGKMLPSIAKNPVFARKICLQAKQLSGS